jgi:hypothetical protein
MSETVDDNKPSAMVRVPTPLIPAVRELSRLHRQGRTSEVLQGLDELIWRWIAAVIAHTMPQVKQ